eukprot:m.43453 g.43453  ORF g.43453 m.43453 type:complete len:134 (-) comp9977_c0_seq2:2183-2584(-)
MNLPMEILLYIAEHLTARDLVAFSQVCQEWAALADTVFASRCAALQLQQPRYPRGNLSKTLRPWKTLYLTKSCKACHGRGVFPILMRGQIQYALLCGNCARNNHVAHRHMAAMHLTVATESENGRKLSRSGRK